MGIKKKYFTEEERKAARSEYRKQYYQQNKDKELRINKEYRNNHKEDIAKMKSEYATKNREHITEYQSEYYQANKEEILKRNKEYYSTQYGRAKYLVYNYRRADRKHNRGICSLTEDWIVENIFTQPCRYCGKDDWTELGCDRINNDLPHTPENVVPCCGECNSKKGRMSYDEYLKLIGKTIS